MPLQGRAPDAEKRGMKKSLSAIVCLGFVISLPLVLRLNSESLVQWQSGPSGRATMELLKGLPYVLLALSALWAARIANTPVYVLSLAMIPAHYYFSGGSGLFGAITGGEQMRFVLFMLLPVLVTVASFVSHRTLSATWTSGLVVLTLGFLVPPLLSATFGRSVLSWVGAHRWGAAGVLGAPSSPTIYYLSVLALNLILPFDGREGQMKKILAALIPCFYFSGVFRPIFQSGPLHPPGLEELTFAAFTSAAAGIALYANFYLSWSKAYIDDLTQVLGRRALNEEIGGLKGTYAIAMVDIDHFKTFNDTYGHAAGDVVLRQVAAVLSESSGGQVYRYGGEEFSILFPAAGADVAHERMEQTRKILEETFIPLNGASAKKRDKQVNVRISAGISESGKKYDTPEDVLRAADGALYKAKEGGRNRVDRA